MYIGIILTYMIWAVFCGWRFVNGRFAYLEQEGTEYKILKWVCIVGIGIIFGGFYLVILLIRFINLMSHMND